MPVEALSLVGFLAESEAEQFYTKLCAAGSGDPKELWADARGRLGPPVARTASDRG